VLTGGHRNATFFILTRSHLLRCEKVRGRGPDQATRSVYHHHHARSGGQVKVQLRVVGDFSLTSNDKETHPAAVAFTSPSPVAVALWTPALPCLQPRPPVSPRPVPVKPASVLAAGNNSLLGRGQTTGVRQWWAVAPSHYSLLSVASAISLSWKMWRGSVCQPGGSFQTVPFTLPPVAPSA
jgi:hypothetical protein